MLHGRAGACGCATCHLRNTARHSLEKLPLAALRWVPDLCVSNLHARQRPRCRIADGDDVLQGKEPQQPAEETLSGQQLLRCWSTVGVRISSLKRVKGKGVP